MPIKLLKIIQINSALYICIDINIHTYIYMYTHTHIYIYAHIYTQIRTE